MCCTSSPPFATRRDAASAADQGPKASSPAAPPERLRLSCRMTVLRSAHFSRRGSGSL